MHVYFDTEFLERGPQHPVSLISIGMVAADGREYYAIDQDAPWDAIGQHPWLMEYVVPHLPLKYRGRKLYDVDDRHPDHATLKPRDVIQHEVNEFLFASITGPELGEPLDLWADCGGYDRVILGQLYGTMSNFPSWLPYWQHELRSLLVMGQIPSKVLPLLHPQLAHSALADAQHLKSQVEACVEWLTQQRSTEISTLTGLKVPDTIAEA